MPLERNVAAFVLRSRFTYSRRGPMRPGETDLDRAKRHVAEAEAHVARQKQIIDEMERDDHPEAAERARNLLATFCRTLEVMRAHLAELRASTPTGGTSQQRE